ncbi:MAG: AAA family ATPase [Armatimonadetes bacterium]|nr:AAA family ATPase [Akkermansiaceae bacterium]
MQGSDYATNAEAEGSPLRDGLLATIVDSKLAAQLDVEISHGSILSGVNDTMKMWELIEGIGDNTFKEPIQTLRNLRMKCGGNKKHPDFSAMKRSLPAAVISGFVDGDVANAGKEGRLQYSGFIQIDIDGIENPESVRDNLIKIPYIAASFISPSGDGVKAIGYIGKCTDDEYFLNAFLAIEADMRKRGIEIDKSCKNSNRFMLASWDEDLKIRKTPLVALTPRKTDPKPAKDKKKLALNPTQISECAPASRELVGALIAKSQMARNLYESGEWEQHKFESPSEADFSLGCSICEVTSEPAHQEALFRSSALYRDERKLRLALQAARKRVTENAALSPIWQKAKAKENRKSLSSYLVNHRDTLDMNWKQIDALRPPPIIFQFIRQGEVLLLGAESKSRKSWLAQDAGFAVAAGLPWLADDDGENGFPTKQARVHVFDLELNPSEMRFRFAKARGNRFAHLPEQAAAITERIAAYSFDGLNVRDIMPKFEDLKGSVRPGDLVIIDCLYRLVPDGNETADVAEILETVKRFASETQAGVILVDHFRKAGDDKARNRFAGSFVKQASASTLVAIETAPENILVLNIDARTFHGCPRVFARFNLETYTFNRLPEFEIEKAKQGRTEAEALKQLGQLWGSDPRVGFTTAAGAGERWRIKRQASTPRLRKLVARGWLQEQADGAGKSIKWKLTQEGITALGDP